MGGFPQRGGSDEKTYDLDKVYEDTRSIKMAAFAIQADMDEEFFDEHGLDKSILPRRGYVASDVGVRSSATLNLRDHYDQNLVNVLNQHLEEKKYRGNN